MKVVIEELFFEENELFDCRSECDHTHNTGKEYLKCVKLYSDKKDIIVPVFSVDEQGNAIPVEKEKKAEGRRMNIGSLWKFIQDTISCLSDESDKDIYVYVCYRSDIENSAGICADNEPLYKEKRTENLRCG